MISITLLVIKGKSYVCNQCDGDIFDWYENSSVGEYTRYYNRLVFHTEKGIYVAYENDIENGVYM